MSRAVLFDKDGTLFGFAASWDAWTKTVLIEEGRGDPELTARLAEAVSYDMEAEALRPDSLIIAGTPQDIVDIVAPILPEPYRAGLLDRLNARAAHVHMAPVCDLPDVLGQLRAQGWGLGVVTNDSHAPSLVHLDQAGIRDLFGVVIGFDSGHGGKPAPDGCLAAAQQLGAAPEDCYMVGDSLADLLAGRAAGMTCIGVTTGLATAQDLAPHADHVLTSIADLPALLA